MANLRTYADLIADVKDKFGENDAVFGDETDNSIRKWIMQKEYAVYSERKWPFMRKSGTITTTASDGTYSLASDYDWGSLYDVVDSTNNTRLTKVSAGDIDTNYAGLSTEGTPICYYTDGTGDVITTLTGTIDPAASVSVVGVGTLFTTELEVGDQITVSGETRRVATITDDTHLTVDVAFTDGANDTSPDKVVSNVQQISLYPIPAGTYTLTYRYYRDPTPTNITSSTTNDYKEPILPRKYRALLVDAVLEELLQKDTNATADRVNVKYQNMIARMKADYADEPDSMYRRKSTDEQVHSFGPARYPSGYPRI